MKYYEALKLKNDETFSNLTETQRQQYGCLFFTEVEIYQQLKRNGKSEEIAGQLAKRKALKMALKVG